VVVGLEASRTCDLNRFRMIPVADGPQGDHPVGRESLNGADRIPVVAELGVVVVLDDNRTAPGGPVDERQPALGRKNWRRSLPPLNACGSVPMVTPLAPRRPAKATRKTLDRLSDGTPDARRRPRQRPLRLRAVDDRRATR